MFFLFHPTVLPGIGGPASAPAAEFSNYSRDASMQGKLLFWFLQPVSLVSGRSLNRNALSSNAPEGKHAQMFAAFFGAGCGKRVLES